MTGASTSFTFALPPSLGREPVRDLARRLAVLLYDAGFANIVPTASYGELQEILVEGKVDAAWGPPIICAQIELLGGKVLYRALRNGSGSYRAVVLCRSYDNLSLDAIKARTYTALKAVWVDAFSMAGYILPRFYLRDSGADPKEVFVSETTVGSYEACFNALLEFDAHVTASFCPLELAPNRQPGYIQLCGGRASQLQPVGFTAESPNDGVVISPAIDDDKAALVAAALRTLYTTPQCLVVLNRMFTAEGYDEPAAGTYGPLLGMIG